MNMNPTSPLLMRPDDTALVVVDVQDKLMPLIPGQAAIIWNIRRLLDAAQALGVPALTTEQYPKGLGGTVKELIPYLPDRPEKLAFSCVGCTAFVEKLAALDRQKVLVVGIEAHVCVQQTVLDLLSQGYAVFVAVDAIGARFAIDKEIAIRRMEISGAFPTTVESAMFEWCKQSGTPEFKRISQMVREQPPAE